MVRIRMVFIRDRPRSLRLGEATEDAWDAWLGDLGKRSPSESFGAPRSLGLTEKPKAKARPSVESNRVPFWEMLRASLQVLSKGFGMLTRVQNGRVT